MSAPAHAFAIRSDMDVRQYIHNQFEKELQTSYLSIKNSGKKT